MQLRGARPFFSNKYDITKHHRYAYLSDYDKKNTFSIERHIKKGLKIKSTEEFEFLGEFDETEL